MWVWSDSHPSEELVSSSLPVLVSEQRCSSPWSVWMCISAPPEQHTPSHAHLGQVIEAQPGSPAGMNHGRGNITELRECYKLTGKVGKQLRGHRSQWWMYLCVGRSGQSAGRKTALTGLDQSKHPLFCDSSDSLHTGMERHTLSHGFLMLSWSVLVGRTQPCNVCSL